MPVEVCGLTAEFDGAAGAVSSVPDPEAVQAAVIRYCE
jgi:hypothetical protein